MNGQSAKLQGKVKSLTDDVKSAESELKELKEKEKEVLASLIDLQKLKEKAPGGSEQDNGVAGANKKSDE